MKRRVGILAIVIVLTLTLMACTDTSQNTSGESGTGLEPAQIDPAAPADTTADTVDDANAATNDRTSEVYELTDSE